MTRFLVWHNQVFSMRRVLPASYSTELRSLGLQDCGTPRLDLIPLSVINISHVACRFLYLLVSLCGVKRHLSLFISFKYFNTHLAYTLDIFFLINFRQ